MSTQISRDPEGYLVNPEEWSEAVASELAAEEDIELTEKHWVLLNFVREYFNEHAVIPDIRHAAKHMAAHTNCDKKEAKKNIFELFPYGYVKQVCKISGMKRPRAWSTG